MTPLLVLWIALVGADRVNLLGAHSAFVLTPYLALTPVVIFGELVRRHRAGTTITLSRSLQAYVVLTLVLLSLCLASVFASRDLSSAAPRAVLLAVMLGSSLVVLMVARDRADFSTLLARGGRWGIAAYVAFNIAEILSWLKVFPEQFPATVGVLRLSPDVYAGVIPRLSGMVMDSNRGGLVLVVLAFLVAHGDSNRSRAWRWVSVAAVLILLTLSRSALLASVACLAMAAVNGTSLALPRRLMLVLTLSASALVAALLFVPRLRDIASIGIQPLLGRLSVVEGSSQDHLRLLERGTATATESVGASLQGLGYGSSHTVLQDFFPGDRYGNFHSIYVGIFAESGVFALLTLLLLIGIPLMRRNEYRALAASVAVFGAFYGALSEPAFWLTIALAWMALPPINSRPKAMAKATVTPRIAPSSN